MERNRQKLVGRDKGSLREQQREQEQQRYRWGENTTQTAQPREPLSRTTAAARSRAASEFLLPRSPPTRTQHDGTWYGIPCSVWPGRVSLPGYIPSWIPVKINSVLAKPRTSRHLFQNKLLVLNSGRILLKLGNIKNPGRILYSFSILTLADLSGNESQLCRTTSFYQWSKILSWLFHPFVSQERFYK